MGTMEADDHRAWVGGSNVPGNPLRSYRMSMLAHGFVDTSGDDSFELDETDPMTYSVVRLRGHALPRVAYAVAMGLIIAVIVLIVLAA